MTALKRYPHLIDALLIFLFVAVLIWPLFKLDYMENWGSIESTFIADGRFLRDHWVHPNWQPNWYGGTRTDYVYPPALRYGTAALSKFLNVLPSRAYHLYIAFFYCVGVAAVYLFARVCGNSRYAALAAGVLAALVSPCYLFIAESRIDAPLLLPHRLNVLIRYGEGPHMTAMAWLPLALLFCYRALEKFRPVALAFAAATCAMVVANNFYGATALAILFPILVASIYITHRDVWIFLRAASIGALAYGLTAFWLVPSYVQLTLNNMRFVSSQGNMWSIWVAGATIVIFLLLAEHLAARRTEHTFFMFLCGAFAFVAVTVLGNYYADFRIIGEPGRLYPEFDLLAILFVCELVRRLLISTVRARNLVLALTLLGGAVVVISSWSYVTRAHTLYQKGDPQSRVEYHLQDWMHRNMPSARAMVAGGTRFWYNAWHDLPQLGGGSEQGLMNPMNIHAQWQILMGEEGDLSILWMKVMGVDAVVVNYPHSKDHYRDYATPQKFEGKLPVAYDDRAGNVIYNVPRRYPSLARVVDRSALVPLPRIPDNGTVETLTQWHTLLEQGPEAPTTTRWEGTDRLHVKAPVAANQSVLVQITYDTNWRAYSNGQRLPTRNTPIGLLVVDAPAGTQEITLEFPTPKSNKVGYAVSATSFFALVGLVYWHRKRRAVAV